MTVGPGVVIAGAGEEPLSWRAKADDLLLEAYDAGESPLKIVVQGPRIPAPPEPLPSRAAWRAYWAAQAEPFLSALRAGVASLGGEVTSEVPAVNAAFVLLPREAVPAIVGREDVRLAGLDTPDAVGIVDEGLGDPGLLAKLGDTIAKVQAQDMWALGYRGEGVKLAVIDTGIRSTHEMFKNADGTTRVALWSDVTVAPGGPGYCENPCDENGHGTHTASTAAGSNLFNANSPQGVAPRATLIIVRIFQGSSAPWEVAQAGLNKAFDLGAEITSNSWGGGCSGGGQVTAELAETLQNAGMMNVFAAGNSGAGGVICPGIVDNVLTVGAIDINEVVAGFSSRGPCTWRGVTRVCPDVNAVGVDVEAAIHTCDTCYASLSGTSMATPHVAGAVALLQQARVALKGAGFSAKDKEAEVLLRYTAKDLGAGGPDNDYGWGLAKARDAYDVLTSTEPVVLRHVFSVGQPVIRAYNTNTLTFAVANLGTGSITGAFRHAAEQVDTGLCPPTCEAVTITDESVTLGSIRERVSSYDFVGADHAAGTWVVKGTYADLVSAQGSFLLKKVEFQKVRNVPASANVGTPILGGIVLRNIGNENATAVTFKETFDPKGHAPLPALPPGVGPYGLFANPAPDKAQLSPLVPPGKLAYRWNSIGEVKAGKEWVASYNLLAAQPGSYLFEGDLTYRDELGVFFAQDFDETKTVMVPV